MANGGARALDFFESWIADRSRGSWREGTYGVGGFFRDRELGREPYDLDLVVESPGGAEKLAKQVHAEFPQSLSSPHPLGKSYPIWEITFKAPLDFNGRTFDLTGVGVQIADTQKEAFMDPTSRQRVTSYGNLAEDCARRDFTVNMLYWDLAGKKLVDPSGQGLSDLKSKKLRAHPQVDPVKIFAADPLRILRMFRFQAQLEFEASAELKSAALATRERIGILSAERIRDEFNKAANTCGLAPMIRAIDDLDMLAEFLPEILPMKECAQDALYHSEGDVFAHTMLVMERAPKNTVLQWAALLHDLGKPAAKTVEGDRIKFIGHEIVSENQGRAILERLVFPSAQIEKILTLVKLHLRGGDATQWKSARPARKLLRELGEHREDWFELVQADSKSSLAANGKPRLEHLPLIQKYFHEASLVPISKKPILSGTRIMAEFKIPPGPEVGEMIALGREIEDEFATQGKELNAETILRELRRLKTRKSSQ